MNVPQVTRPATLREDGWQIFRNRRVLSAHQLEYANFDMVKTETNIVKDGLFEVLVNFLEPNTKYTMEFIVNDDAGARDNLGRVIEAVCEVRVIETD
jgi:hypothetical protein